MDSDSVPAAALVPAILSPALAAQTWWPEGQLEVSVQPRTIPTVECPSGPTSERGRVCPAWSRGGWARPLQPLVRWHGVAVSLGVARLLALGGPVEAPLGTCSVLGTSGSPSSGPGSLHLQAPRVL